ncbi:MAG: hypothetical protein HYU64_07490 [Armatimonadetes bacterium]|nr:hypothetical protein [Armatimonadota bacterium]
MKTQPAEGRKTLNLEFNFGAYVRDSNDKSQVLCVPGEIILRVNDAFVYKTETTGEPLTSTFENEVSLPLAGNVLSLGPVVRKGPNKLVFEFIPRDSSMEYEIELRFSRVMDQAKLERTSGGTFQGGNLSALEAIHNNEKGRVAIEKTVDADFAQDRPWHHYPPVSSLTEGDRKALLSALKGKADLFSIGNFPKLIQELKAGTQFQATPEVQKLLRKGLEKYLKRHKALNLLSLEKMEFLLTGRQEVLILRKGEEGFLVNLDPDDAAKAGLTMDEGSVLAGAVAQFFWKTAYARNPQGLWERVY